MFNNSVYILLFLSLFLFASCGAKKKVLYGDGSKPIGGMPSSNNSKNKSNLTAYYADLLGSSTKGMNGELYLFIDQWMGSPHRLGGQTRSGIDCSAFVGMVYNQVYNKNLPRTSRDMAQHIKRKYDDQLQEGDLIFFSFGGKDIDHVGVYLQNGKFVHVSTKQGVVISNLKDAWYYKYLTRCGTPLI